MLKFIKSKEVNVMNRKERAGIAEKHVLDMNNRYPAEIEYCIRNSVIYGGQGGFEGDVSFPVGKTTLTVVPLDSVSAAIEYKEGRTAILNFASFKHPGGGFISGSMAQEEALCHESILYNVLSGFPDYYAWNNRNLNRSLYYDRAIYTPDVIFERDSKSYKFDIITCASPNKNAAIRNGASEEENSKALLYRVNHAFTVAAINKVDTFIVGAFGCGVFGQDPEEVGAYIKRAAEFYELKKIICAIPPGNRNLEAFESVISFNYETKDASAFE